MQLGILNGIYSDGASQLNVAFPRNVIPTAVASGISEGNLQPAEGIDLCLSLSGLDRGGINWNDEHYRVIGADLVKISRDNTITVLGSVGNTGGGIVKFDYSFDYLAVLSDESVYLYNGTLTKITDIDLGPVIDFCWADGYFIFTDGEFLIINELNDPFAINPLKYGSSETDPDPITSVIRIRDEVLAVNRYTIEFFTNVGSDNFPYQRINGAQIQKGAIGTRMAVQLSDAVAFVGGGRNEALGVYVGSSGNTVKISDKTIDGLLASYDIRTLSQGQVETRVYDDRILLLIHLPKETLVYDAAMSKAVNKHIWYLLDSGVLGRERYCVRNFVWVYNSWYCGHKTENKLGKISKTHSLQFGGAVAWDISTAMMYAEGKKFYIASLELVALPGRVAAGVDSTVHMRYTLDGMSWSQPKYIPAGNVGERLKRLQWRRVGMVSNWVVFKFGGDTSSHLGILALQVGTQQ
jgi:hypothetical protein